jgi:DNA polymerase III epsilon subunit-like protein
MIINHWGPTFTRLYGHVFPESYLCLDLEYLGWNPEKDLVWEIGHILVENRRIVDQLSIVLDWTRHPVIPEGWLRRAIDRSNLNMLNKGKEGKASWDLLASEGIKPEKALAFYYKLIQSAKDRGLCLAGHNLCGADERMLAGNLAGFLQKRFTMGDRILDVGAMEKATLAIEQGHATGTDAWWLPRKDDTLRSYFRRVCNRPAKGIFWNLADALRRYGLDVRYDLDLTESHRAEFDAYMVHLLVEEFRSHIYVSHANEDVFQSPETLQRGFEQALAKKAHQEEQTLKEEEASVAEDVRRSTAPKDFQRRRRGQRSV